MKITNWGVHQRARVAALAVGVVAIGAGYASTNAARAATVGTYTAAVTPHSVVPGSSTVFTVTFTNTSPPSSAAPLQSARVTLPSAFAIKAVGTPSGTGWTASTSGQTVTISDGSVAGAVLPGGSVSVPVTGTAAGSAMGSYTWTTSASLTNDFADPTQVFSLSGDQPSVAVHGTAYSNVPCPSGSDCNSGKLSGTSSSVQVDSPASNQATSDLQTEIGALPKLQCTGHGDVFRFYVPNRTATVTYIINGSFENGLAICWVSAEPFRTSNGSTATFNPVDGGYEGLLARCGDDEDSAPHDPCIQSQVETEQPNEVGETLVTHIYTPIGDPVGSGH